MTFTAYSLPLSALIFRHTSQQSQNLEISSEPHQQQDEPYVGASCLASAFALERLAESNCILRTEEVRRLELGPGVLEQEVALLLLLGQALELQELGLLELWRQECLLVSLAEQPLPCSQHF